jgi:O-antigen/teichoic acid export membrane protein
MALTTSIPATVRAAIARPVLRNAASMYGSALITSGLGFVYWIVAARAFPIDRVGIASAAISAMVLLGQAGLLGLASMTLGELAREGEFPVGLVSVACLVAGTASLLLGVGYVLLAPVVSAKLGRLGHGFAGPALFALGTGITGVTLVLDQAVIGINRPELQLNRNIVFSAVKLLILPIGAIAPIGHKDIVIFTSWLIGNLASLVSFWIHTHRLGIRPHLRPAFRTLASLRRLAFAHHWLNVADQVPRLLLPVIVSITLTSALTAAFYTAALIVGIVAVIPAQLSTALFALPRGQLDRLATELRSTLKLSIAVSLAGAVAFAALAHPLLLLFGHQYTKATTAMILLGLSTLPYAVKVHYASVERVRGHLMRCAAVSTAGAAAEIGLSFVGAKLLGLDGVSLGMDVALGLEMLLLWPVVARAARLPLLPVHPWRGRGRPRTRPEVGLSPRRDRGGVAPSASHGSALASGPAEPLLPGDPVFISYWEARQRMTTGAPWSRLVGLWLTAARIREVSRRRNTSAVLPVEVPPTPAGEIALRLMTHPVGPSNVARPLLSVVRLPATYATYVSDQRGGWDRARQAELSGVELVGIRSAAAGIGAFAIACGWSPTEVADRDPVACEIIAGPGSMQLTALDSSGRILAVAVAVVAGKEAFLARLEATNHPLSGSARWLLHNGLVAALIERGVVRLWADGPLSVPPVLQALQRELGYACAVPKIGPASS